MNKLIYGKNTLERIVGLEPNESTVEVFIEFEDGTITSQILPHQYWILSSQNFDGSWHRLKGNAYYKYGKQYTSKEEWSKERSYLKRRYPEKTYSIWNNQEACQVKDGLGFFKGCKPLDISTLSFDIETTGLDPKADDAQVLIIANTLRINGKITRKLFCYDDYTNEAEFLESWCSWVREVNPSIIVGHNIFGFDIPYLNTRASINNTSLALGRDGSDIKIDNYEKKFRVDGNRDMGFHDARIYGRSVIDTMFLAIKSDISREFDSYGLKWIINYKGWEVEDRQFYDAATIKDNYKDLVQWGLIKKYAEMDGDDALKLYDEFIPPFFYMTQKVPKSFQNMIQSASGSQLNAIMSRGYLQEGEGLPRPSQIDNFEGAISLGNAGIYDFCVKWDLSSLYPSIMEGYNIGPKEKDPHNHFLTLVTYLRTERLKNKQLAKETGNNYYKHMEQSEKILANSLYGALGAPGLCFNSNLAASQVTSKGREILNKGIDWSNSHNFRLVNADTDSIMVCRQDGSIISDQEVIKLTNELNDLFPEKINWEMESTFNKVIVLKAKTYVLDDGKKVKYKGSALKSPVLEAALREFIKDIVNSILKEQYNYEEIYLRYVKEILNMSDIKRWAKRMTISSKTMNSERANESKVRDAIEDSDYVEGDRVWTYFANDDTMKLVENYNNDANVDRLLEKLFKTALRFESIIPNVKEICLNYKLKRNKEKLGEIR